MSEFSSALGRYFRHAFTLRLPAVSIHSATADNIVAHGADCRGLDFVGVCTPEGHELQSARAEADARLQITLTSCVSGIFEKSLDMDGLASLRADAGMREFSWDVFLRLLSDALQGKKGCNTMASLTNGTREHLSGEVATNGQQGETSAIPEPFSIRLIFRFQLEAATLVSQLSIPRRSVPGTLDSATEAYLVELRNFWLHTLTAARAEGSREAERSAPSSTGARPASMAEERGRRAGASSGKLASRIGGNSPAELRGLEAAGLEASSAGTASRAPSRAIAPSHSNAAASNLEDKGGLRRHAEGSSNVPGMGSGSEVATIRAEVVSRMSFAAVMEGVKPAAEQAVPSTGSSPTASVHCRGESVFAGVSHQVQNQVQSVLDASAVAGSSSTPPLGRQRPSENASLGHAAGNTSSTRSAPAGGSALLANSASIGAGAAKRAAVPPKKRCGGSLVDPRARKVQKGKAFQLHGA